MGERLLTAFQNSVRRAFLEGCEPHSVCIAPTGSGKGVIVEEILRQSRRKSVILVPLNALGRQTAERLVACGVGAEFLGDSFAGSADVLVVGPERLEGNAFRKWLGRAPEYDLFVDEAHCVEDWGSGFRPSFRALYSLVSDFPPIRSLWLTATLPRSHLLRIETETHFKFRVHGHFSLPANLELRIRRYAPAERFEYLNSEVIGGAEPQIFFCNTRRETENWARLAQARGIAAPYYHAGLSREERTGLERRLRAEPHALLFATSAFGMGMDFAYLRRSTVASVPYSLLSLIQAVGRAGRGMTAGRGEITWSETDFRWNAQSLPGGESAGSERDRLREFLELRSDRERSEFLSEYFV